MIKWPKAKQSLLGVFVFFLVFQKLGKVVVFVFVFIPLQHNLCIHVCMSMLENTCSWPTPAVNSPSSLPSCEFSLFSPLSVPVRILIAQGWAGPNSAAHICLSSGIGRVFHGSIHSEVLTAASQAHLLVLSWPSEINSYNTTIAKFINECKSLQCSFNQIVLTSF